MLNRHGVPEESCCTGGRRSVPTLSAPSATSGCSGEAAAPPAVPGGCPGRGRCSAGGLYLAEAAV